jgi:CheY-like chemotaxis protein
MRGSIFVVEDDRDVLDYYEFLLRAEGFSVWAAETSGEAAIERYRRAGESPDAVILDHRLPGCTGLTVAQELLVVDPDVMIVFVTADDVALESARSLGIRRLKRKPCDNQRLLRNLHSAVAERRERIQAR